MADGTVELVVRLPADLHQALKARAEQEDRSMAAVIRQALRRYVDTPAGEAGPQATPGQVPVCDGFVWIGQPMTSCDRCGQPAWEHQGLDQPPADPFSDAPSTVRPWEPGEAEAIRAKWGRVVAVPTDHEDPTDGE